MKRNKFNLRLLLGLTLLLGIIADTVLTNYGSGGFARNQQNTASVAVSK
jgi:hypothetical protein